MRWAVAVILTVGAVIVTGQWRVLVAAGSCADLQPVALSAPEVGYQSVLAIRLSALSLGESDLSTYASCSATNLTYRGPSLTTAFRAVVQSGARVTLSQIEWVMLDNNLIQGGIGLARFMSALPGVRVVQLFANTITGLAAGTFAAQTQLLLLDLGINPITTLPAATFSSLHRLQALFLDSCDLQTLPAGIFSPMTSLHELYLSANPNLSSLPSGALDDLPLLSYVYESTAVDVVLEPVESDDGWCRNVSETRVGCFPSAPGGATLYDPPTLPNCRLDPVPNAVYPSQRVAFTVAEPCTTFTSPALVSDLAGALNASASRFGNVQVVGVPENPSACALQVDMMLDNAGNKHAYTSLQAQASTTNSPFLNGQVTRYYLAHGGVVASAASVRACQNGTSPNTYFVDVGVSCTPGGNSQAAGGGGWFQTVVDFVQRIFEGWWSPPVWVMFSLIILFLLCVLLVAVATVRLVRQRYLATRNERAANYWRQPDKVTGYAAAGNDHRRKDNAINLSDNDPLSDLASFHDMQIDSRWSKQKSSSPVAATGLPSDPHMSSPPSRPWKVQVTQPDERRTDPFWHEQKVIQVKTKPPTKAPEIPVEMPSPRQFQEPLDFIMSNTSLGTQPPPMSQPVTKVRPGLNAIRRQKFKALTDTSGDDSMPDTDAEF
ncbi:hypothetical protein PBRA_003110 [Plasmodiophora brassicae]|uniref:Leucine-rich repeat-containing N-terminal plant-type domain-containing protein n=1 Tax=Plasmodiophora brassicae TaxID=37360 RepID=A0A0G4J6Z7_PLABS|nr:hypothetical protein PBRA_003110 [Plasmodiophora brassicae]